MAETKITFPGVNGMFICDCGATTVRVGMQVLPGGANYIRCLKCADCGKTFAVPFFDDASRAALQSGKGSASA